MNSMAKSNLKFFLQLYNNLHNNVLKDINIIGGTQ